MTAITTTTLYTQSWTTFQSIVNTNVTDPVTNSTSSGRKWIYTLEPDIKAFGFKGYPFIVIEAPELTDESYNIGRDFRKNILRFKVTLYQRYTDADSISQLETMANQLVDGIRKSASITIEEAALLFHPKIQSSSLNDLDIHNQRVITRVFMVEFETPLNMG